MNSITYFETKIKEKLEKIFLSYSFDMTKITELVYGVTDCMVEFGLCLLAEELESYDIYVGTGKIPEKEEIIYSSSDLWREERKRKKNLGCFADVVTIVFHIYR